MSLEDIVNGFKKAASNFTKASLIAAALIAGGASYTNNVYAAGDNSTTPVVTTTQTEIYKGTEYTAITNKKGETIYVPTTATPQNITRIIEEELKYIQNEINAKITVLLKEEPIEELTIDPNLEEKLDAYLSWVIKNKKTTPENLKELEELEKETGYPLIVTYNNFKIKEENGKTYLVPIKEDGRYGYAAAIKLKKPKEDVPCTIESTYIIRKTSEGTETELKTREPELYYDKETEEWLKEEGIDELLKASYPMIPPLKETELEVITHLCIMENPNNPKKATLYASPPYMREYTPRAYSNR